MPETPEPQPSPRREVHLERRRENAARALGMRVAEIVEVGEYEPLAGGEPVLMADGTRAVVHPNGLVTVFVSEKVTLSPAAHALNPMVRFADLAESFGPLVARGTDSQAVVDELAAIVEREKANQPAPPPVVEIPTPTGPPVVEPVPAVVEPVPAVVEPVPDGSAEAVLEWVGDDVDRARRALNAEGERARGPRAGLSKDLTAIIAAAEDAGGGDS